MNKFNGKIMNDGTESDRSSLTQGTNVSKGVYRGEADDTEKAKF